jgi:hypothetical protein
MNYLEVLLSDTRKARNLKGVDLANKKDEVLGGGNYGPETELPFWHNDVWHCHRQSQKSPSVILIRSKNFG